jgi:hypothetical protein
MMDEILNPYIEEVDMQIRQLSKCVIGALVSVSISSSALAQGAPPASNSLPPLGWSSWNSFSNTISSSITQKQADALISTGLKAAGYNYVNIDEGWWLGKRDASGNIIVDPKQWPALAPGEQPGDMGNIVRYIHARGLKAGIYTDAGAEGCSIYPDVGPAYFNVGSHDHYEKDFVQFAKWGFDYVKVDWCGGDKQNLSASVQYAEIARAIDLAERITGKRLYYSICDWGKQSPWTWGPGVGGARQAIWRTGGDIIPPVVIGSPNEWRRVTLENILKSFDDSIHPEGQHTGYYNDADMMVVGMPGTTEASDRTHMALWAMSGGPLLIGADLTKLRAPMIATLGNADAVAIDQDALGLQAVKVGEISPGLEIWSKRLSKPGTRAVMLLNRGYYPAPFTVDAATLGLAGRIAAIREIWSGRQLANVETGLHADVPARNVAFFMVEGTDVAPTHFTAIKPTTGSQIVFDGVKTGGKPFATLRLSYRARTASVRPMYVNEDPGTRIAFSKTTQAGSAWLQVKLDRPNGMNRVVIEKGDRTDALEITGMDVY